VSEGKGKVERYLCRTRKGDAKNGICEWGKKPAERKREAVKSSEKSGASTVPGGGNIGKEAKG